MIGGRSLSCEAWRVGWAASFGIRKNCQMGFQVKSALAIIERGGYDAFLVYVPSRRMEFAWINDWMDDRFSEIADRLEGKGALIVPSGDGYADYNLAESLFCDELPFDRTPYLIAVRCEKNPTPETRPHEGVAIHVGDLSDQGLAQLFDALLDSTNSGTDIHEAARAAADRIRRVGHHHSHPLDEDGPLVLQPNFFGLGVNLHALLRMFRRRRADQ